MTSPFESEQKEHQSNGHGRCLIVFIVDFEQVILLSWILFIFSSVVVAGSEQLSVAGATRILLLSYDCILTYKLVVGTVIPQSCVTFILAHTACGDNDGLYCSLN